MSWHRRPWSTFSVQVRAKIIKEKIWFLPAFPRGRESDHELKQQSPGVLAAPGSQLLHSRLGCLLALLRWMPVPVRVFPRLAPRTGSSAQDMSDAGKSS